MELTTLTRPGRGNGAHRRGVTARAGDPADIFGGGDLPVTGPAVGRSSLNPRDCGFLRRCRHSGPGRRFPRRGAVGERPVRGTRSLAEQGPRYKLRSCRW